MNARCIFESQLPESIAEAYSSVQSLVARDRHASLEELQGAVEYLLDTLKAAQGLKGAVVTPAQARRLSGPRNIRS